jgi:hypothetical protein
VATLYDSHCHRSDCQGGVPAIRLRRIPMFTDTVREPHTLEMRRQGFVAYLQQQPRERRRNSLVMAIVLGKRSAKNTFTQLHTMASRGD